MLHSEIPFHSLCYQPKDEDLWEDRSNAGTRRKEETWPKTFEADDEGESIT
jgi:hypothetical protein